MQLRNWIRRGLTLVLAAALLMTMLPAGALAESVAAQVAVAEAKVYQKATMKGVYAIVPEGTRVTIKGVKNGIAQISRSGYIGYVDLDDLEPVSEQPKETEINEIAVLTSALTVYASPSTSAKKAVSPAGMQILVVAEGSNGWMKLKNGSMVAYVQKDALEKALESKATPEPTAEPTATPEPVDVVVTKKSSVYKSASTSAKKLGTVYAGEELQLLSTDGNWALIDKDGNRGFMNKENLKKLADVTPEPTAEPTAEPIPCVVTANTVAVYKKASTTSTVLGKLKKGELIDVVDVKGNWALVDKDGNRGYALKGGLTPASEILEPVVPDVKFTATVISESMPIYQTASTKADKLTTVVLGTTVKVHEGGSTWAMISVDGTVGYAQIKHMSARSYDTYASGDSGSDVKQINELLLKLGYYDSVPGSDYGSATVAAIKRLQIELGMDQTGKADITLMRLMNESELPVSPLVMNPITKGDKGENVQRIQTRLHALGYLAKSSSVDADFGPTTQAAVKLFQKAASISQSGTVDAGTMKALYSVSAPKLPSGSDPADQASAEVDPGSSDNSPLSASGQKKVETVISYAYSKLGCKYVFGSSGPNTFDCSGLTMASFSQVGVKLPHSAYTTAYGSAGTKINYSGLVRGDVVCLNTNSSDSDLSDHVGIYLGSGKFIHASSGSGQVIISDISSGYYNRVFSWAKRFIQ